MSLKCKRASFYYGLVAGREYEVEEVSGRWYRILTAKGSSLWVTLRTKDYEFEIIGGEYDDLLGML